MIGSSIDGRWVVCVVGKGGFLNKVRAGQKRESSADAPRAEGAQHDNANSQRLVYLIAFNSIAGRNPASVKLFVETLSSGEAARAQALQPFRLQPQVLSHPPRFLNELDITALQALLEPGNARNGELIDILSVSSLQKLVLTERSYLTRDGSEPDLAAAMCWSTERLAQPIWNVDEQGKQRLDLYLGAGVRWFSLSSKQLFYFDDSKNSVGNIENLIHQEVVDYIARQRSVDPFDVAGFLSQQASFFCKHSIAEPVSLPIVQVQPDVILPQLRLFSGERGAKVKGTTVNEGACLGFEYCFDEGPPPEFFPCRAPGGHKALFFNGTVYQVHRDLEYESKILASIQAQAPILEFVGGGGGEGVRPEFDFIVGGRDCWRQLFTEQLPDLKATGCEVVVDTGFPFHFVSVDEWYGDVTLVQAADKIDWFDFELGVRIDGEAVNLLPSLLALVRRYPARFSLSALGEKHPDERVAVPLADGRLVDLSVARLRGVLSVLVELLHNKSLNDEQRLSFPAVQATRLVQLQDQLDGCIQIQDESGVIDSAVGVEEISQVELVALPKTIHAELRDYQHFGVSWLVALKQYGMGGILADDMGLGKTLQTLAFLAREKQQQGLTKPALIVMPTSLLFNWLREAQQFTPSLTCLVYHGAQRASLQAQVLEHDIIFTTYGLMVKDWEYWQEQDLSHLILDEAQNIKNSRAKVSQALKRFNVPFRLCLSGTPMENNVSELWSLFDFVLPGYLDSSAHFKKYYQDPIEKHGDSDQARALFSRVAPFILRRCKSEVATELPPKTESVIRIPLQEQQQDLYESVCFSIKQNLLADLQGRGEGEGRILILNALLKLRQICCDPRLANLEQDDSGAEGVADRAPIGSAKLEHTLSMIGELVAEGRKILLFSQFTSMLSLIGDRLREQKLDFVTLTGKSSNRQRLVEQFQQGDVPVFLISLKAGGVGLNLTAADTVIHYDPWWNPAVQQQATDRAYRIGQDKPVFVYKLIMEDTVEEKIFQLQERKQMLLDGLNDAVQHRSDQLKLTQQELLAILA